MPIPEDITKEELFDVIAEYNNYVQTAAEDGKLQDGWVPVCVNEFYDNEYQDILEERKRASVRQDNRDAHARDYPEDARARTFDGGF